MEQQKHLDTLQEIRSMMERSSRFISLSGLSGIGAGLSALLGATLVYIYLDTLPFRRMPGYYVIAADYEKMGDGISDLLFAGNGWRAAASAIFGRLLYDPQSKTTSTAYLGCPDEALTH